MLRSRLFSTLLACAPRYRTASQHEIGITRPSWVRRRAAEVPSCRSARERTVPDRAARTYRRGACHDSGRRSRGCGRSRGGRRWATLAVAGRSRPRHRAARRAHGRPLVQAVAAAGLTQNQAVTSQGSASQPRLAGLLFGVSTTDARTWVSVPLLVLAVAGIASFVPALRAARLEPMKVLRDE